MTSPRFSTGAPYGVAAVVIGTLSLYGLISGVNFGIAVTLVVLSAVSLFFALYIAVRRAAHEGTVVNFGVLLALQMFLGFGLGACYYQAVPPDDLRLLVSEGALLQAVVLGLVGCASLLFGYEVGLPFMRGGLDSTAKAIANIFRDAGNRLTIVVLIVIGWTARAVQLSQGGYFHTGEELEAGSSSATVTALALLPSLAFFILAARRWGGSSRLGLVWLLFLIEILWYLPSGARSPLVALAIGAIVLRSRLGGRIPIVGLIVATTVAVVVVFPVVAAYRGTDSSYSQSIEESALGATQSTFSGGPLRTISAGFDSTLRRFSDFQSAAKVFDRPEGSNVAIGSSLGEYVLTAPIPRAVDPEKPDPGLYGNEFGRFYGLIALDDTSTSISVSQPLFNYLQAGWLGVVLLGFLYGLGYRLLEYVVFSNSANVPVLEGLYALFAFSVGASTGTIWPLGFLGLVKQMALFLAIIFVIGYLGSLGRRQNSTVAQSAFATRTGVGVA